MITNLFSADKHTIDLTDGELKMTYCQLKGVVVGEFCLRCSKKHTCPEGRRIFNETTTSESWIQLFQMFD